MANRRQFLQTAAALSAASLSTTGAHGREADTAAVSPSIIVLDRRHDAAQAFGRHALDHGAPVHEIEGDITQLWLSTLRPQWTVNRTMIAGLTERPALFLLEHLGFDFDMRVVFEAEHAPGAQGAYTHKVLRSAMPALEDELHAAGRRWPLALGAAMLQGEPAALYSKLPSGAAMAAHLGEEQKLYSWIIAPRQS